MAASVPWVPTFVRARAAKEYERRNRDTRSSLSDFSSHAHAVDRAGEAAQGDAVAGFLLDPFGATAGPENPGGYDPLAHGLKGRSLSIRV